MTAANTSAYDAIVALQDEAKRDAEAILRTYWSSARFPVDPVRIARSMSLTVLDSGRLPGDVAGTIVKEPGRDALILLNASDHPNRKRFTLAHEIGHYVRRGDNPFEYVDRRDTLSSTGTDPDEIYANAFAANLLMPESEFKRLHREGVSDFEMALRFGVSRDAVSFRHVNLGLRPH
jgi:IrrE N-terminal-like domain